MKKLILISTVLIFLTGCGNTIANANNEEDQNMERDVATSDSDNFKEVVIDSKGEHVLSGEYIQTQIVVDVEDDVTLVLDNVLITNSVSAPIYIKNANSVEIKLKANTYNTLTDGVEYIENLEENINAVIYSKSDLILSGSGQLKVNSNNNDAINSNDDLTIKSGTYLINSVNDAFTSNDSLLIEDGNFKIITGEGSENAEIKVEEEPFNQGGKSPGEFQGERRLPDQDIEFDAQTTATPKQPPADFDGETFPAIEGQTPPEFDANKPNFNTTKEDDSDKVSAKAFKTDGILTIETGEFIIDSVDDAIHSNDELIIDNGTFEIKSGDDAIHGSNSVTINNGKFNIEYSYEGIESETIIINDGELIINSLDDAINAVSNGGSIKPSITVNDGEITFSSDYDGFDSNGNIEINGGVILGLGNSSSRDTAFDFDFNTANINGGEIIAASLQGQNVKPFSQTSKQSNVMYVLDNLVEANTVVTVYNKSGKELLTLTPTQDFQVLFLSSSNFVAGEEIEIKVGEDKLTLKLETDNSVTTNYVATQGRPIR